MGTVLYAFGDATEDNELDYSALLGRVISQIEIYNQVWFVRNMPSCGKHCDEEWLLLEINQSIFRLGGLNIEDMEIIC